MSSSRTATLFVTVSGGFISLVLSCLFAFIGSSISAESGTLWTLFGISAYLFLISVTCTYLVLSRARRQPILLAVILLVLPCIFVSIVLEAGGSWMVLFIPTIFALAFVMVGVVLTWRLRS